MTDLIDRTLSVGLLHAAASEAMIRRAMKMHEAQGMRLRHEAKQTLLQFYKDYKHLISYYRRLKEAQGKQMSESDCKEIEKQLNAEYKRMTRLIERMQEASGQIVKHEAKRALTDFNDAYKRFARAYDRLQELATDKNIDQNTAQLFDAFLNDSGTLAMVSMLYFNATNESNPNWERNTAAIMNTLKTMTLGTVDAPFSLEFINQFAPKL